MLYHNFSLQPGHVEDTCLCEMSVSHDEGFSAIEEAMENFRLTIVAYIAENQQPRACCKKNLVDEENDFCSKCGRRLDQYREASEGEVQDFFMKLPMTTLDGGADILRYFEERGWHLEGFYHFPDEKPCSVRAVARWMGREGLEDFPYMEGTYPNGEQYCSFRESR